MIAGPPDMSRARRWLPVSGALAAILMVSTALIAPPPPVAGAPAAQVLAYFAQYHAGLEVESLNLCLGMVLLLVFAATLHDWLGNTASLTALVAIAVMAGCTLLEVAVFQSLAYRPNPDAARATLLNDLQDFAFQVTTFPALLFLASSAYAILTTRRLPRRAGQAAAIAAALQVVAWVAFFAPSGRFAAGGIPSEIAFAALVAWVLGGSATMLVVGRPATAAT
ncbi:MAG TPA: hypothetical protein VNU19_20075 [Candidatus Acidoferrum sp.]|nr:hypothetical protein [Candidatus Acidoferrum sp.]